MNRAFKFIKGLFSHGDKGFPCFVISYLKLDAGIGDRHMLSAKFYPGKGKYGEVTYTHLDQTEHRFVCSTSDILFTFDNRNVFSHKVGDIFSNGRACPDSNMTSSLFADIYNAGLGKGLVSGLEDWKDEKGFDMKLLLIIGGVIVGIVVLAQTGILEALLSSIQGVIPNQTPTPISPDSPIG